MGCSIQSIRINTYEDIFILLFKKEFHEIYFMEIKEIILSIQSNNQKMVDQAWMELIGRGGHDPKKRNNSIIRCKAYSHLNKKYSITDDNICDLIYEQFIEKLMTRIHNVEARTDQQAWAWFWKVLGNVAKDYFKSEDKHYRARNKKIYDELDDCLTDDEKECMSYLRKSLAIIEDFEDKLNIQIIDDCSLSVLIDNQEIDNISSNLSSHQKDKFRNAIGQLVMWKMRLEHIEDIGSKLNNKGGLNSYHEENLSQFNEDEEIVQWQPINELMWADLADCVNDVLENKVSNDDYVIAFTERYINGEPVEYIQSLLNRPSYSSTTTMINAAVKKIVPMLDKCKELV